MGENNQIAEHLAKLTEQMERMNTKIDDVKRDIYERLDPMSETVESLQKAITIQQAAIANTMATQEELREQNLVVEDSVRKEQGGSRRGLEGQTSPQPMSGDKLTTTFQEGKGEEGVSSSSKKVVNHVQQQTYSAGSWSRRTGGGERGHRRSDGGGDWNVSQIGGVATDHCYDSPHGDTVKQKNWETEENLSRGKA
ncbi:PREDICTED: uncharacterized protein LOC104761551 [Camelina sativa]|uniref:Uncharacterized protein LOC104761551 n=1 Tax=Camelina sativa TaxID=90675 RepID=A0ABM0XA70_CAMSA|nr:PREDICTED: uncharacterized protein LOC104761551 [Camelina sativa]